MSLRRALLAGVAACAAAFALPAVASAAQTLHAITTSNHVITFNSSAPGDLERDVAVRGLQEKELVLGLDRRPGDGRLYALGSSSRVYVLDPVTGIATPVGNQFSPRLNGTAFGFDFDPTADLLRTVTDLDLNLLLSPQDGSATAQAELAYAKSPQSDPVIGSLGYVGAAGAKGTALYGIDSAANTLVRVTAPQDGTLETVGPLGVDAEEHVSLDVAADGTVFAALTRPGSKATDLYTVDVKTGRAKRAAGDPRIGIEPVRALAAAGSVAADRQAPQVSVSISSTQLPQRLLSEGLKATIACNEACDAIASATVRGRSAGSGAVTVARDAGLGFLTVPLDAATRQLIAQDGRALLALRVVVTDKAGNRVTVDRQIRERVPPPPKG